MNECHFLSTEKEKCFAIFLSTFSEDPQKRKKKKVLEFLC